MGFVAAAAKEPLKQPASMLRNTLLLVLSPPSAVLMGPYVPNRAPATNKARHE